MKDTIKKWLKRIVVLFIMISSAVSCYNSFDNRLESKTLLKIDEIQLEVDCILQHLDSVELTIHSFMDNDL